VRRQLLVAVALVRPWPERGCSWGRPQCDSLSSMPVCSLPKIPAIPLSRNGSGSTGSVLLGKMMLDEE
jgi:hypothetical protein